MIDKQSSADVDLANKQKPSLPVSYFSENRSRLLACLPGQAMALLTSGKAPHRTSDESYPFWANRNFYYLAGLEQDGLVLLLLRDGAESQQVLYVPEQDSMHERWRGHLASREEASALSGLADIRLTSQMKTDVAALLATGALPLWLDGSAKDEQYRELQIWLETDYPDQLAAVHDIEPLLTGLRMVKQESELEQLGKAIDLTGKGIAAMLRRLRPGLMEYHLWSAFSSVLADEGCLSPAFASIVASGKNIFCLHYMTPYAPINAGDLVQVDVGAIVGGLCADISRVFPASGRFSPRQRQVYDIVRRCQETAFATIRPGITLAAINEACRETARQGLTEAGFMREDEAVTDYFWHNVSHHLGLDVHDVSDRSAALEPGMVLTVEPGVYMPAINIGMRIEDDVMVTEDGCRVLSQAIPREAWEIEALMRS